MTSGPNSFGDDGASLAGGGALDFDFSDVGGIVGPGDRSDGFDFGFG